MTTRKKGLSVAGKMAFGAMLLVLASVGAASFMALKDQTEALTVAEHKRADLLVSSIAILAAQDILNKDIANLTQTAKRLRQNNPELMAIAFYDYPDNRLLAESQVDAGGGQIAGPPIIREIRPSQLTLGHLHMVFDRSEIETAKNEIVSTNITIAAGLLVTALVFSLIGASFFSRPIERLAEAADKVAGGNLSVRVDVASGDELGHLAGRFNEMVKNLEQSRAELEKTLNELSTLYSVSQIINSTSDREEILKLNIETLATGFNFTPVAILLEVSHQWQLSALRRGGGASAETTTKAEAVSLGELKLEAILTSDGPVVIEPGSLPENWGFADPAVKSVHAVALRTGNQVVGILIAGSAQEHAADEHQILSVVGSQIAPPILISIISDRELQKISDPFMYIAEKLGSELKGASEYGIDLSLLLFKFEASVWKEGATAVEKRFRELSAALRKNVPELAFTVRYGANRLVAVVPGYSKKEARSVLMKGELPYIDQLDTAIIAFPEDGRSAAELLARAEGI